MKTDPAPDRRGLNDGQTDGLIEDAVAEYLDRLNSGETVDPKDVLVDHPGFGNEILESLEEFLELSIEPKERPRFETLGDYTIRRQIGRGGMGVVYEAWQNSMDRPVALKVLPPGVAADNKTFHRFMREAKTAGQLQHQNVVGVFAMGVDDDTPYYAMELVEGRTLAQIIATLKKAAPEAETSFGASREELEFYLRLARAFVGVADGLWHAHSRRVIHRDIKPSNLILDGEGHLRILDFGLARFEGQESLTVSGDLMGTVLYMSPEQAMAKRIPLDHRTDIYSLGATMYEALTSEPPFHGKDHHDTLSQIMLRDPVPPGKANSRVPRDLETIVLKCLRKSPDERYGTAEALAQDLRRFVRGDPIEARPEAPLGKVRRWMRRRRTSVAFTALLGIASLLVVLLSLSWSQESQRQLQQRYDSLVEVATHEIDLAVALDVVLHGKELHKRSAMSWVNHTFARSLPEYRIALRIDAARNFLEEAARIQPDRPEALYQLARGNQVAHRHDESLGIVERLLILEPRSITALDLKAALQEALGDPEAAERTRMAALAVATSDWERAWLRAGAAFVGQRAEEAVTAYTDLLRLDGLQDNDFEGSRSRLLTNRGIARLWSGDHEEARWDLLAASGQQPGSIGPILLVGRTYALEGDRESAEAWFEEQFGTVEPALRDELVAHIADFWNVEWRWNDEPTHREEIDARILGWLERLSSNALRQQMLCQFYSSRNDDEKARARGKAAVRLSPENGLSHALLGGVYVDTPGEQDRAVHHLEQALKLEPGNVGLLVRVSSCFHNLARYEKGVELARRALELHPGHFGALKSLALNLDYCGDREGAEKIWLELEKKRPDDPHVHGFLASIQRKIGKEKEALRHGLIGLKLAPNSREMHVRVANVYSKLGSREDLKKAIQHYQRALELSPGDRWSLWGSASCYEQLGDYNTALERYSKAIPQVAVVGHHSYGARVALSNLLRPVPKVTDFAPLDEFVEVYEEKYDIRALPPIALENLALAYLYAPERRNLESALDCGERAVEESGEANAEFVVTLATIHFAAGDAEKGRSVLAKDLQPEDSERYRVELENYWTQSTPVPATAPPEQE